MSSAPLQCTSRPASSREGKGASDSPRPRWIVSQIGRREDYCAARALLRRDQLARLYTDCWVERGRSVLKVFPRPIKDLRNRFHPDLVGQPVVSFERRLAVNHLGRLFQRNLTPPARKQRSLIESSKYDRLVADHLRRCDHRDPIHAVMGFTSGSLETLSASNEMGTVSILDQTDTAMVGHRLVAEEHRLWPGWEPPSAPEDPRFGEFWEHVRAEWNAARVVLVNSEFSRAALIEQGVPGDKIIVVPLSYEREPFPPSSLERARSDRLQVLWLGTVSLGKGIQYLWSAAQALASASVDFVIAGPIQISPEVLPRFGPNVRFLGKVSGRKSELYRDADVFVLPTVADGFAITQIEAMSHGLPVITTPNCGSVVTDGVDGYIVPIRDGAAIAERLLTLHHDRDLLRTMSRAALRRSQDFSLDHYGASLISGVERVVNGSGS